MVYPYGRNAEDVIRATGRDYLARHRLLKRDIMRLHASLEALRSIARFPWRFYAPGDQLLPGVIATALYEHAITTTYRVWLDNTKDAVTIPRQRTLAVTEAHPRYQASIKNALRRFKPSDAAIQSLEEIRTLRNTRVGHLDWSVRASAAGPIGWPTLRELKVCALAMGRVLRAISFPRDGRYLVPSLGRDAQHLTDIIATDSDWSRDYDSERAGWQFQLPRILDFAKPMELMADLNERRARVGMAPIPWTDYYVE